MDKEIVAHHSAPVNMKMAALEYAERGWHVFPLHNALFDSERNCIGCTCEEYRRENGQPEFTCRTPGKHPRMNDWEDRATTDPQQINKWWHSGGWQNNGIGIACGPSGLIVFDLDEYKGNYAGDDILTAEDKETCTALSGGGGEHLYFQQPEGERFGSKSGELPSGIDIKGWGGLIVAPPTIHKSARRYTWEDGYDPDTVPPQPLPDKLYQILKKAATPRPSSPRSVGSTDADDVRNALSFISYRPDYDEWRNIIFATVDAVGPDDAEFLLIEWRPEESQGEYRRVIDADNGSGVGAGTLFHIAKKNGYRPKKEDSAISTLLVDQELIEEPHWVFTEKIDTWPYEIQGNQIIYLRETKDDDIKQTPIAHFRAQIVKEYRNEFGSSTYVVSGCSDRGGNFTAEIDSEQFSDTRKLKGVLESAAGPRSPVLVGMDKHLGPAIKLCSNNVDQVRRYNRTGWSNAKFLIVGNEKDGDVIDLPSEVPADISGEYDADIADLVNALMRVIDTGDAATVISAILGPPLAKLCGWDSRRYTTFIKGQTGTFKTSTIQAFMTIYGHGYGEDANLVAWGDKATPNAIMKIASHACDMPFFIDNYKPNTGKGPQAFISTIHSLMEGGDRKRLDRTAKLRESVPINCWPICTGEDMPDNDAAALARSLVVQFHRRAAPGHSALSYVQSQALNMPAIGKAWIDWLETDEAKEVARQAGEALETVRQAWAAELLEESPDMPNAHRVASTLAVNRLTYAVACSHPVFGETLSQYRDEHREALKHTALGMGNGGGESLEGNRFLWGLRDLHSTGRVIFLPVGLSETSMDTREKDRIIGWRDTDGSYYVLPTLARSLIEKTLGDNMGGMTNSALYAQIEALGLIQTRSQDNATKTKKINGKVHRVLHLTQDAIDGILR